MELLKPSKPLVSVVLPTYNRADYLKLAISSVLSQDFKDFELVVINDGSTDETENVVASFQDDRITYVRQKNQGEYPATNNGINLARGKYITWIHSDDMWPEGTLSARVKGIESDPTVDFVHGDIKNIDEKGEVTGELPAVDWDAPKAFDEYYKPEEERTQKYLVHHTTILFRKEFIEKTGYWDETLPYAGDTDWMLRALKTGKMKKVPGVLYLYRNHPEARRITDREKGVNTSEVVAYIMSRYKK